MTKKRKIIFAIIITIVTLLVAFFTKQSWIILFLSTILALFPDEIKNRFKGNGKTKQIRISYSYLFRIFIGTNYLLVKDEQDRNLYHPVGGVYKYYPDQIDVVDRFSAEFDTVHSMTEDTKNDLRLILPKKSLKNFNAWFKTNSSRENILDLSREFKEELIDTNIISKKDFPEIKYKYLGSYLEKSFNSSINMHQIRHFDLIDIKLTESQQQKLKDIMSSDNKKYIFANKTQIEQGILTHHGMNYKIADNSKLILINSDITLKKELDTYTEYSARIN